MDEKDFENKIDTEEKNLKKIRHELDERFKNVTSIDDLNEIHFRIEDYLDQGYEIREYVGKYNELVGKFNNQ